MSEIIKETFGPKQDVVNKTAYTPWSFPPKPTGVTKFFRTCLIWQFIRFVAINFKMLKVVRKSH